ncbi:MAG: response regulator [Gammaproteobacteria bacterium]
MVEDDPTFETSMTRAVAQLGAHWRYASFRTASEALHFIDRADTRIDLALVDIGLPDISGIEVISQIRSRFPEIPIMVVSVISAERSVLAAIRAGARGYVLKDDSTTIIAEALRQSLQGNYPISPALARYLFKLAGSSERPGDMAELTPKELELLRNLSRGRSYAEAALEMGIALSTVQTHIRNLYRKLDVHSQVQAVTKAQDRGLI